MSGFDNYLITMNARGMSVHEIQVHLLELYGTEMSPDPISTITDEVLEEGTQWQQRTLEAMYPIVAPTNFIQGIPQCIMLSIR